MGKPMSPDMVHTYVRDLIERIVGAKPTIDDDGDLRFRHLGAQFFARVHPRIPVVQVFAIAVDKPDVSPALFEAINEINAHLVFDRGMYVEGQILIEQDIYASELSEDKFSATCRQVAEATDIFAHELAERFNGQLAFDLSKGEDYPTQPEPRPALTLGYL